MGTYDPQYWDDFLTLDPEVFPPELLDSYTPSDDPEVLRELYKIPTARDALNKLQYIPNCERKGKCSQEQKNDLKKDRELWRTTIGLHVNHILMEKNAPLIKAVEQQKKQAEIDAAVKLALEEKVRETATPQPTPEPILTSVSYLPLALIPVVIIGAVLLLRRRG